MKSLENLPPIYRNAAIEGSRVSKMPQRLAMLSILSTVGVMLRGGLSADLQTDAAASVCANLLVIFAAGTCRGKGKLAKVTQAPFRAASAKFDADFGARRIEWLSERAKLKARLRDLEKAKTFGEGYGETEERLAQIERVLASAGPILDTSSATPEALLAAMARNRDYWSLRGSPTPEVGAYVALSSLDGANLLKWLEPSPTPGGGSDSQSSVILSAAEGEAQKSERATRAAGRLTETLASVSVFVTPPRLRKFLDFEELRTDGTCGRFLYQQNLGKIPAPSTGDRGADPRVVSDYVAASLALFEEFGMALKRRRLKFSAEATKILVEFAEKSVKRTWDELADVEGFAGRWGERAEQIALILWVMERGPAAADGREIDAETARKAVEITEEMAADVLEILAPDRSGKAKEINDNLLAALERAAKEGGLKPGLAYRLNVGKTPAEGRAIVEKAAAEGRVAMVYTWRGNQETALAFLPGSRALQAAERENERVISARIAAGKSAINHLDPIHSGLKPVADADEKLPELDFSYPKIETAEEKAARDPLVQKTVETFGGRTARVVCEEE